MAEDSPLDPAASDPSAPSACHAAASSLVLYPDGSARVCCISNAVLGNVAHTPLRELWFGDTRRELRARLEAHDFSMGCQGCGAEIALEGREDSYAATFDRWLPDPTRRAEPGWPRSIYFNLSNRCNLQCVQCDGELSSSIRRHREHLPALPMAYGERFFEELREFVPHLREAEFAGGEPFLAPETYRVLDLVHELAPTLRCKVTTNGTQWNERVVAALDRHRFDVKLSLDGLSRATFEAIRVGADHEVVMSNLERFHDYTKQAGTRFEISHCLMPANVEEFADLVLFAESRGIPLSVSVVRDPPQHSIAHLEQGQISAIFERLVRRDPEIAPRLELNRRVWQAEVARIGVWAQPGAAVELRGHDEHRIMWFDCDGVGPTDLAGERRSLATQSVDGRVFGLRIGRGQRITRLDDDFTALVGRQPGELVGRHVRSIIEPLSATFGSPRSMADIEIVHQDDDRVEQLAAFPAATLRLRTVAVRDAGGRAEEASLLIARVR